jgi:acetylornithine deacetylase/succinyl-diaminopimelate desuccinylase-like protein
MAVWGWQHPHMRKNAGRGQDEAVLKQNLIGFSEGDLMPRPQNSILLAAALLSLASPALARTTENAALDTAVQKSWPEFIEFLRLPNVATQSAPDIRRNAQWAQATLAKHGWQTQLLPDGETPMVFAQWKAKSKSARTILFYAHMDGQPVFPKAWNQASPFEPVLRAKDAQGVWQDLPLERLAQSVQPDPEWRLFARSAADDKAPILMLIAALDALVAQGKAPAINIKLILDSHEEGGPPTLADVVEQNRALLQADGIVMLDGPMHESGRPTVVYGHRGGTGLALTVYGPKEELHSGHFGNYAANPAMTLARLITGMKDAEGRVLIPGFYDGVDLNPSLKQVLAQVPDDEAALQRRLGIAASEKVGASYQESLQFPSLNITSMIAGEPAARRTIIPAKATVTFDIRTVPGTPAERQIALVRKWVETQGFHLVQGEPSEAERARYPLLASITGGGGMRALMTPLDAPIGQWLRSGLTRAFGQAPVQIPIMGGGVPSAPLADGLKAPVILLPLVNADDSQHAANENLRIGNYSNGVKSLYALITNP